MRFPTLRLSTPVAIVVMLFAVLMGPLFFYFGLMNLIHPDVPAAYLGSFRQRPSA